MKTMKKFSILAVSLLMFAACKSKKNVKVDDTLPKHISQKESRPVSQTKDREHLESLREEIEKIIASETCTNTDEWRISPFGSKPCGGPSSYIAYPKNHEEELLPKISEYNAQSSAFNQKYGLMSDCAVVPAPSGIRCENGKAVLVGGSAEAAF